MEGPPRKRLVVEGFGCVQPTIGLVYDFLETLTEKLGMQILSPPVIVRQPYPWEEKTDPEKSPWDYGISAQLMWKESGCSVHTVQDGGYIALDAFSCREMDKVSVIRLFASYFEPCSLKVGEPDPEKFECHDCAYITSSWGG